MFSSLNHFRKIALCITVILSLSVSVRAEASSGMSDYPDEADSYSASWTTPFRIYYWYDYIDDQEVLTEAGIENASGQPLEIDIYDYESQAFQD